MPFLQRQHAKIRCVIISSLLLAVVAFSKEDSALVKRDTTLDNVKAMYNRFITDSTGKAKYIKSGQNACSLDPPPSITKSPGLVPVAASKDDFQLSLGCGVCLEITGSGKAAAPDLNGSPAIQGTMKGIIMDQNDSLNQGDLALLPPQSGSGLWEISFKAIDCPTGLGPTGYIQFRFTGSNEMYFKLQAMNTKVPVVGIEAFERVQSKWYCLTRTPDNFFSSEGMGAVSFPLKLRLTSIMNEQLETAIEGLINNVVIKSEIQFSDTETRGGSPEGIQCYGQGNRAASSEGDESFCVSKEDGIYSDEADDTAFYICEGEKATKKLCPNGLKFNPLIASCDVPQDVNFIGNVNDPAGKLNTQKLDISDKKADSQFHAFSVGDNKDYDESNKHNRQVAMNGNVPHKLFSINIFKGPKSYSTTENLGEIKGSATDNNIVQDNKEQYVSQNGMAVETELKQPGHDYQSSEQLHTVNDKESNPHDVFFASSTSKERDREGNGRMHGNMTSTLPSSQSKEKDMEEKSHHQNINMNDKGRESNEGENTKKLYYMVSDKESPNSGKVNPMTTNVSTHKHIDFQDMHDAEISKSQHGQFRVPHKLFAINIYGGHPDSKGVENQRQIGYSHDNNLSKNQAMEELLDLQSQGDTLNNNQTVHMSPMDFQSDESEVLSTPGVKSEYDYEQDNPYAGMDSKPTSDGFSRPANDDVSQPTSDHRSVASEPIPGPIHFKLHINMDNSGKQPVINCTVDDCSENETKLLEDERAREKLMSTQEQMVSSNSIGSQTNLYQPVHVQGLFGNKDNSHLHITLNTDDSQEKEDAGGINISPKQENGAQMGKTYDSKVAENPQIDTDTNKFPASLTSEHSYQVPTKERNEEIHRNHDANTTEQKTDMKDVNVATVSGKNIYVESNVNAESTDVNRGKDELNAQDNVATVIGNNIDQTSEIRIGTKINSIKDQNSSIEKTETSAGLENTQRPFTSRKEAHQNKMEVKDVSSHHDIGMDINMAQQQNYTGNPGISPENISSNKETEMPEEGARKNFSISLLNKDAHEQVIDSNLSSNVQTTQQQQQQKQALPIQLEHSSGFVLPPKDSSSYPEEHNNLQFSVQVPQSKQHVLQMHAHDAEKALPQLKIILKSPGKIGMLSNPNTSSSASPLGRRSDARGHIVEILKSLIDRPLKVGSKNKEVVSMLSSLMNTPIQGKVRGEVSQSQLDSQSLKDSGDIAQSILEANKEFLDDVAMQGMLFSDGDQDAANLPSTVNSLKQEQPAMPTFPEEIANAYTHNEEVAHQALHQSHESAGLARNANRTAKHNPVVKMPKRKHSPVHPSHKLAWVDAEQLISQMKNDEDYSGMGEALNTTHTKAPSALSNTPGKSDSDGSGGLLDVQIDDYKNAVSVTVGQYGSSEVNAYKGGTLKTNINPKLKSFCIGKSSGVYSNPFDLKSFLICSNGVTEERVCPTLMRFNHKEKICDLPNENERKENQEGKSLQALSKPSPFVNSEKKSVEQTNVLLKRGNRLQGILKGHSYKRSKKVRKTHLTKRYKKYSHH